MTAQRKAVLELVAMHKHIVSDPCTDAIWLPSRGEMGISLLEVVPTMPKGALAEEPLEFLPSDTLRYGVRLYCGRLADIADAIRRKPDFARLVAGGEPVPRATSATGRLQRLAKRCVEPVLALIVYVGSSLDGTTFGLEPLSRLRLCKEFPEAVTSRRVWISHEREPVKRSIARFEAPVLTFLMGVSVAQLAERFEKVMWRRPDASDIALRPIPRVS